MEEVVGELPADNDNGSPYLFRPYDSAQDEDAMHYLLGVSYTRSRAGQRAGASRAGGSRTREERASGAAVKPEAVAKQKAFLAAHSPIWTWLLENAEVTLACDPQAPHIIWGWRITSEPNVLHALGCKRSLIEAGLATDLMGYLMAPLRRFMVCTLELPQMRAKGSNAVGIDRMREWSLDPTWLITRMYPPGPILRAA